MRKYLFFLLACVQVLPSTAQNLVVNPSFEDTQPDALIGPCEFLQHSVFFAQTVRNWTTFRNYTPDLLTSVENCPWLASVHTGERCLGLITYLPASDLNEKEDYHEIVQGRLKAPLIPGQRYRVECWVREDSSIIKTHLTRVYSDKTPIVPSKAGNLGFYFFRQNPWENRKPQVNFAEVIETNGAWVRLSAEFVPDQPFDQFLLGNFFSDRDTKTNLKAEQNRSIELKNGKIPHGIDRVKRGAYLCIDDVSVERVLNAGSVENSLLQEKKFTFSAQALFDFGKYDLKPEAGPALDSLAVFLKSYPKVRIGIGGHTDDVGTDEFNLDLSERRAQAVRQFLLDRGVADTQLRAKGFGESKPIADNITETGRQANRRVECVVLKTE
ncbi:MAG: OmpA family protein [Saprospiraceae bacterium]|nr:OmpA family protein [Saprospiraceae bacterium]